MTTITNGDFWGLMGTKNHGDSARGKIVDVIHNLSPKVPIIFRGYCALDVEISLKYGARRYPNKQQSQFSYFYQLFWELMETKGTSGDYWGLMGTTGKTPPFMLFTMQLRII